MSDGEKFADVFNAAADGIANAAISDEYWADFHGRYPESPVTRAAIGRNFLSTGQTPSATYRLGMHDAYRGIGEVFAKVAAAEHTP